MLRFDHGDRARLALRGPDRARFLHGMVTCAVEGLASGQGSRAAMLSVKGRLLAVLDVHVLVDELLLSMEAMLGEKVRAFLDKHIVMDDVELVGRTAELGELGLYGDDAAPALDAALGVSTAGLRPHHHVTAEKDGGQLLVARDPSLGAGLVGFRVLGPRATVGALGEALGAELLTADAYEVRRVEAGTARYGVDLDEDRLVVEANLEDAITPDKGCYLGQEVVVRATTRGRVNRKLVGLVVSGEEPVPRGTKLAAAAHAEAGITTSSVLSERLGGPIALGYVHRAALDAGAPLSLPETGRRAIVVALPFDPEVADRARAALREA